MSIQKHYNQWSEVYDNNINKTRDLDSKAIIEILDNINFKKVIELGCGTGKNTQYLLNKADIIYGLDFSEKMLEVARKKLTSEKVNFIQTDILQPWPVNEKEFDLITINLTMEHIKDLDNIFLKAYEFLKSSGLFYVSELHPFKQYLGSKAKFDNKNKSIELKTFTHNISDFWDSAKKTGFNLIDLKEWFDENEKSIPRLVTFLFQK